MGSGRISARTRVATFVISSAIALGACAGHTPYRGGEYAQLSPAVAATKGERQPLHLTVQLARPANVAVFYVVPGRASILLFPEDSTQSGYVEGGAHLVETSLAKRALTDTSKLIRRPPGAVNNPGLPGQPGTPPQGRNGRGGNNMSLGDLPTIGQRGFLLIYASQEPLPYAVLSGRVAPLSVPAYDDDALNTVTKLIRESTKTTGPWAAAAADFPP